MVITDLFVFLFLYAIKDKCWIPLDCALNVILGGIIFDISELISYMWASLIYRLPGVKPDRVRLKGHLI